MTVTAPYSYFDSGYRLNVIVTDDASRVSSSYTNFSTGYGESPNIYFNSSQYQSFASPDSNLIISNPVNLPYSIRILIDDAPYYYNSSNASYYSNNFTFPNDSSLEIAVNWTHFDGTNETQIISYQIDGIVNTLPDLILTGTVIVVSDINVVSPTTVISISNLTDDTDGVGYSSVECRNGSVSWTTVSAFTFNIPSLVDSEISYSIECRILDLLGNVGNSRWSNGTVDSLSPTVVAVSPVSASTISLNSSIDIILSDNSGMGTSQLNWIWTDGSSSTYVNNSISGTTWIGSPSDIFGVIGDGTMSLTINAYDALGNLRTDTGYSWSINTTLPLATISLTGASYGN